MNDKQPEALRLANNLERMVLSTPWDRAAAAELRRLHTVNQALVEALEQLMAGCVKKVKDWNFPEYDQAARTLAKAQGDGE